MDTYIETPGQRGALPGAVKKGSWWGEVGGNGERAQIAVRPARFGDCLLQRLTGLGAPPCGKHRYVFRIYALNTEVDLGAGATLAEVEAAIADYGLALSELVGTFSR